MPCTYLADTPFSYISRLCRKKDMLITQSFFWGGGWLFSMTTKFLIGYHMVQMSWICWGSLFQCRFHLHSFMQWSSWSSTQGIWFCKIAWHQWLYETLVQDSMTVLHSCVFHASEANATLATLQESSVSLRCSLTTMGHSCSGHWNQSGRTFTLKLFLSREPLEWIFRSVLFSNGFGISKAFRG